MPESTRVSASGSKTSTHVALAVVFQVRAGQLQALLWQRAKDPEAGAWSLPGGYLDPDDLDPADYPRKVLFVAGAGRSGTSTFAGLMQLMGLQVPQPEVVADESNPKGFGEPAWVVEHHDRLLKEAGVQVSDARPDACRHDCRPARCGDRVVDTGESCDDGNTTPGDGCGTLCEVE